jgi:hypothetical protein
MISVCYFYMITRTGFTLGIPDTVMGLTFIAAGVSVPDALSGIAVCKEGHGRPNPKCRLYWCLIEFIDWIYSQLCWYF